jgi:hypothetical protein
LSQRFSTRDVKKIGHTCEESKQIIIWVKHVHADNLSYNEIKIVFEYLALLLHIEKVLCSSLSLQTGFLTERFYGFSVENTKIASQTRPG